MGINKLTPQSSRMLEVQSCAYKSKNKPVTLTLAAGGLVYRSTSTVGVAIAPVTVGPGDVSAVLVGLL